MKNAREIAIKNEILRGIVGSTVHGTAVQGQDDRDEMGIFIEPPEYVCGLKKCDHYTYRDQPDGMRSQPGDLDLVMYSLRKFCSLAAKGNPSVLMLMWLPDYVSKSWAGVKLLGIRDAFVSAEAGQRYLGYLTSQKKALVGERSKKVQRPELVGKYGFDTKFAMHALRLGYQGVEYVRDGTLTLPVPEPQLTTLRAVRNGEISFEETLQLIEYASWELMAVINSAPRKSPDYETINRYLVDTQLRYWGF
jgi:hypothetical protein